MPRETKFNFIPFQGGRIKQNGSSITIYRGKIFKISKQYVDEYQLEGKYMRFVGDKSKRTLGWQIIDTVESLNGLKRSSSFRRIKKNSRDKIATLAIEPLLEELEIEKANFKNLPIEQYEDVMYGKIFYIKIPKLESKN